jgi:MoaA/NifB/PqqE/SkfB family radical SAM enzyme
MVSFIQIEPTTRCNFKCIFCAGRHYNQGDLSCEGLNRILDIFTDLKHVQLQGEGEPLLNPNFFEMLNMLRQKNISVSFVTNGSQFTSKNISRILEYSDVIKAIMVSIDTLNPEQFKLIRTGDLHKIIEGLEDILEARKKSNKYLPPIGLTATVLKSTIKNKDELVEFYKKSGLNAGLAFQPLQNMESYVIHYDDSVEKEILDVSELEDLNLFHKKVMELNKRSLMNISFYGELIKGWESGKKQCYWLEKGLFINYEGNVTPCCSIKPESGFSLGNIYFDSHDTIINNRKILADNLLKGLIPDCCKNCPTAKEAVYGG